MLDAYTSIIQHTAGNSGSVIGGVKVTLQRYEFRDGAGYEEEATSCENGDFVKYADVAALVLKLNDKLESLAYVVDHANDDDCVDVSGVAVRALKVVL
jgi:hypothetical protein